MIDPILVGRIAGRFEYCLQALALPIGVLLFLFSAMWIGNAACDTHTKPLYIGGIKYGGCGPLIHESKFKVRH